MDLSSASTYLNSLLAKAGLLKGGVDVPFHNPSSEDGSITRIINLVHDLVTRREKEEEQLENLGNTIRQLRNDNAKLQQASDKLKDKCEDLERKNGALDGQQKAFNSTLRASEAATKSLRDETTRLKMVLQQVRNQFANDIRKRDVQLAKIKDQLSNPRRNSRNVNTITVTGTLPPAAADAGPQNACGPDCLAQDTADALTELTQTLANENDNLVSITRQTLSTLNSIQGLKDDFYLPSEEESGDAFLSVCPQSYDALSEELQRSLASLRDMLNKPNYVAIEELQERDKIIQEREKQISELREEHDKTIQEKEKEISKLQARIEVVEEEWRKAIEMVKMWNDSMRGKLQNTAVKPVEVQQERNTGGLEQILEEDEEEEDTEIRVGFKEPVQAISQQVEAEDSMDDDINVGDASLDEEQLQREASMFINEDEDEDGEAIEEGQQQGYEGNMEEMLEDLDAENIQSERVGGHTEDEMEEPGDITSRADAEQSEDIDDHELPDNDAMLEGSEEILAQAPPSMKIIDSTPPPTSPPKSPPRPRRTPRSKKVRELAENVSPSPMKLKSTPSKRTPNPRKKAPFPMSPSPIHTKINRFLSHTSIAESSDNTAPSKERSPKKATPRKKTTKHAHFESPVVQDTPEFTTPRRTRKSSASQFVQREEEEVDQSLVTPRRTSRTSKKRVLLDTPEQPASSRVSKRRKTPATKKKGGAKVVYEDDDDFSH